MLTDLRYAMRQLAFAKACVGRHQTAGALDALQRLQDSLESVLERAPAMEDAYQLYLDTIKEIRCNCSNLPCICRPAEWTTEEILAREG